MDFDRWLNQQGRGETEEVDDTVWCRCVGCGKEEAISRAEYDNGDTGWYCDHREFNTWIGVCGGSPRCFP